MTLLTAVFAAIICTVLWYNHSDSKMMLSLPCWLFWGASIMWFIDACFEYAELGTSFFEQEPIEMLNDFYLGLSVVALGLIIWIVALLVKDPKGVVKSILFKKIK